MDKIIFKRTNETIFKIKTGNLEFSSIITQWVTFRLIKSRLGNNQPDSRFLP